MEQFKKILLLGIILGQFGYSSKTTKELASNSENKDRSPSSSSGMVSLIGELPNDENKQSLKQIKDLIYQNRKKYKTCFDKALHIEPTLSAELKLSFFQYYSSFVKILPKKSLLKFKNLISMSQFITENDLLSQIRRLKAIPMNADLRHLLKFIGS